MQEHAFCRPAAQLLWPAPSYGILKVYHSAGKSGVSLVKIGNGLCKGFEMVDRRPLSFSKTSSIAPSSMEPILIVGQTGLNHSRSKVVQRSHSEGVAFRTAECLEC